VLRRIATSSVVILGLIIAAAVVLVANIDFGKGKPPPGTADMSTNEMLRQLSGFQVDPVSAAAEANARKRAFLHEQAVERAARKRAKLRAKLRARRRAEEALKRRMSHSPSAQTSKQYARQLNAARGWGGCWDSLETMWDHESGWNVHAANPSGAYGIPQALPGSKMSSAGPDWRNSAITQITWGLGYVGARYGNPCDAWDFWQAHHWY
jgi:hypothetical protein